MINSSIIVIMDVVCSAARNTGTEKRTLKTILIICLVLVTAAFAAGPGQTLEEIKEGKCQSEYSSLKAHFIGHEGVHRLSAVHREADVQKVYNPQ